MSLPNRSRSRQKQRGFTLVETTMTAMISTAVLFSAITLYISGASNWARGENSIDVQNNSRQGVRRISNELRDAFYVSVDANGLGLTYRKPSVDSNGDYVLPITWDGYDRRLYYNNGQLILNDGVRPAVVVARNIVLNDPFMVANQNMMSGDLSTDVTVAPSNQPSTTSSGDGSSGNNGGLVGNTVNGVLGVVGLGTDNSGSGSNCAPGGSSSASVVASGPNYGPSYQIFAPDSTTLPRAITMKLVTKNNGGLRNVVFARSREVMFLRNVPAGTR